MTFAPGLAAALATWLDAIPAALLLLAILGAAALAVAAGEWGLWRAVGRIGLPVAPSASVVGWIAGPGDLPRAASARGEPAGVAFGFATVTAAVVLAAGLVARAGMGARFPAGLGAIALFPLACALGYAVAAERATTPEAARHRVNTASRILLSTPAWAVAVALWSRASGSVEPTAAARAVIDPLWRAALAAALVWSGLFVLPGGVTAASPASRPWGGDASEGTQAIRLLTGLAHYVALAAVCALGGAALAGGSGRAGLTAGIGLSACLALALRVAATLPGPGGAWVRRGPTWIVPALVLFSLAAPGAP